MSEMRISSPIRDSRRYACSFITAVTLAIPGAQAGNPNPVSATSTAGMFHLGKVGGRHSFIDPQGRPFFALGVNHISAGMPREKRDDEAWGKAVAQQLRSWNFNCAGYAATPPALFNQMPFFAFINLTHCSHFLPPGQFWFDDVFDRAFQDDVRRRIRRVCAPVAGNPNLIGYYWTDTPEWDLDLARRHRGTDWVSSIRARGSQAPGKQRYVKFLRETYRDDIAALNQAYQMKAPSFAWLLTHDFHGLDLRKPEIRRDDDAFLGLIATELYGLAAEGFRQDGGGHLICGDLYLTSICSTAIPTRCCAPRPSTLTSSSFNPWTSRAAAPRSAASSIHGFSRTCTS